MMLIAICLLALLPLSGCGVLLPYLYDARQLQDHLVMSMSKEQLLKQLGKPDRVIRDDGQQTIWEYRLYPSGEWTGYLVHCPFFPNCYFPAEPASRYYVVLRDNRVCLWGTPDAIRSLAPLSCGSRGGSEKAEYAQDRPGVSVIPVFMPPRITPLPERLAIVPVARSEETEINSWLDLTLNFLRTRHRELILVERDSLGPLLNEIGIQYAGHVDDATTIRVGKLLGADSLLIYQFILLEQSPGISAALEMRLFKIESGTTVFRQMASANQAATSLGMTRGVSSDPRARRLVLERAVAYGLAALTAAFGDNPLGLVIDYAWTGNGIRLIDVLQGSPGYQGGLEPGDQIVACNGQSVRSWVDAVPVPSHLAIRRHGKPLEIAIE